MDGDRFDDITKALATGASRRRVLKGIAGAAAGALAGVFGTTSRGPAGVAAVTCPSNQDKLP